MSVFLKIQWRCLNRHIAEAGINILLAWALITLIFFGGSLFLFANYQYGQYACLIFPIFIFVKLSETKRLEFLKLCYGVNQCIKIRWIENLLISIPFLVFLAVFKHFYAAAFLLLTLSVFSFSQIKTRFHFVVPTPFYKRPFEFIVGFRNSFYMIFFSITLSIIGVAFDNFHLGLFGLAVGYLTTLSYYSSVEKPTYVWNHNKTPRRFLFEKVKTAFWFNTLLYLPSLLILSYFFYEHILMIMIVWGLSILSILFSIGMKYANFPQQIGVKEAVTVSICVLFPPLVLVLIPFYYFQSLKNLRKTL